MPTVVDKQNQGRPIDGARLVALAHDRSVAARSHLVEAVADIPAAPDPGTTERERRLIFEILSHLVHETEMEVRKTISRRLSEMPDAPRDLVRLLGNDKIEIAYPILTKSGVLQDEDLLEIIRHRTLEHQLAITIRQHLSEKVSDALVETGDRNVIVCLLNNHNADISRATMEYLVEQSEREDSFQEPVLRRKELDGALAKRMFAWVSDALRRTIIEEWNLDPATVNDLVRQATERAWHPTSPDRPVQENSKSQMLAANLAEQGLVNAETMLRVLRNGDIALFVAMFQEASHLHERFIKRILFDPNGEGLAVACKAIGMNREQFRAVFALTRGGKAGDSSQRWRYRNAMKLFEDMPKARAEGLVRNWQHAPNPSGIWDLGIR